MVSIRKSGRSWRVQVRQRGHRPVTQFFRSKGTAAKWAKLADIKGLFPAAIQSFRYLARKTTMGRAETSGRRQT